MLDPKEMEANLTAILDTARSEAYSGVAGRDVCATEFGPDYQKAFRAVFDTDSGRRAVDPFFLERMWRCTPS